MTRSTWVAGAVVAALAGAWFISSHREAARLAEADRARAEEIRAEARAYRDSDTEERTAQLDARVDAAIAHLKSGSPTIRCDAALLLGRIGTGAQINVLTDVVFDYSESTSVRICAVGALREMGETSTVLGIYESWARDTDQDLRRAAITGFGEIGPEATATALPYLEREFGSEFWDLRYLVVESLGKLGPAADTLLAEAAKDEDANVRKRAAALLKSRRERVR
jgi:HEAT repeat protein